MTNTFISIEPFLQSPSPVLTNDFDHPIVIINGQTILNLLFLRDEYPIRYDSILQNEQYSYKSTKSYFSYTR